MRNSSNFSVSPGHKRGCTNKGWLVVSTHLKNISQNGNLPQIGTVLAKEHALFHLTLKTHYEDTFRRHVAPPSLVPHCLVTPHFPVTPHFGAALFGATLFGDATFSCDATFWRHTGHIFLWRHILAPHSLATHCLVTPHFPVTPHFGATFFGDTLFGDATLGGVTLHRWAWSWLEWFRLGGW